MHIRNNNQLDLDGEHSEKITLKAVATGTTHSASYDLDGVGGVLGENDLLIFDLDKNGKDPRRLTLQLGFTGPNGGVYKLTVSGSRGGDISVYSVAQFRSEKSDSLTYTIDIL